MQLFAESKDEVTLILCGTQNTANALADDESYQNITVARPLGPVDWELLQHVQNEIQPSDTSADCILNSFQFQKMLLNEYIEILMDKNLATCYKVIITMKGGKYIIFYIQATLVLNKMFSFGRDCCCNGLHHERYSVSILATHLVTL